MTGKSAATRESDGRRAIAALAPCRVRGLRTGRRTGVLAAAMIALCAALLAAACPAMADDAAPPEVTSFNLTPHRVNTDDAAEQIMTATVTLTDDLSGVRAAWMWLKSPTGTQELVFDFERISGDELSGVYAARAPMYPGSMPGVWRLGGFSLGDNLGNYVTLEADDLEAKFGAGCADVVNEADAGDSTPPRVTGLSITPSQFDTGTSDQTLKVSATVSDDLAGVCNVSCGLWPATGSQYRGGRLSRVSGDDKSGVYEATITMPKSSQAGVWYVSLELDDNMGNYVMLHADELEAACGDDCAHVTNVASTCDSAPPQVTAFSLSPSEVNTESADQTLSVTVALTDDQSGVAGAGVALEPLIGTQETSCSLERVSGDEMSCVYAGTVTMPKGSKEGMWSVSLGVGDAIGNGTTLFAYDLSSLVPGAEGLVVANTATAQQVTIDREWSLYAAKSVVLFPAGTVVTRGDDGRFAFYEMTAQEFTVDDSIPTTGLDGVPVATLRFGIPGLNLEFSQPVMVSMKVGDAYTGYRLNIQSLTEGGEAWANEATCQVSDGWCAFTVNHATRFVASAAKPSIARLGPARARRGATVTIIGEGFGKKRRTGFVRFGSKRCAKYVSWSETRIKCRVPANAKLGRLKVKVVTPVGTSGAKYLTVRR